jgi:hypothetical protein
MKTNTGTRAIFMAITWLVGLSIQNLAFAASEKEAILHAIAKDCPPKWCKPKVEKIIDKYAMVLFMCKKKDCENDTAYLKKTGNAWTLVEQGTGISPDDLINQGFPANIANQLAQ